TLRRVVDDDSRRRRTGRRAGRNESERKVERLRDRLADVEDAATPDAHHHVVTGRARTLDESLDARGTAVPGVLELDDTHPGRRQLGTHRLAYHTHANRTVDEQCRVPEHGRLGADARHGTRLVDVPTRGEDADLQGTSLLGCL